MTPQQIEAMKLALEALEAMNPYPASKEEQRNTAITAIKQALAQPEQEPVAWLHWLHGPVRVLINKDEAMMELDRLNREYPVDKNARQMKPLYTTPPQRTEQNFCSRCGKRTKDIHTCTPPKEGA